VRVASQRMAKALEGRARRDGCALRGASTRKAMCGAGDRNDGVALGTEQEAIWRRSERQDAAWLLAAR